MWIDFVGVGQQTRSLPRKFQHAVAPLGLQPAAPTNEFWLCMKINHRARPPVVFGAFLLHLTGLTLVQTADVPINLEKIAGGVPLTSNMYVSIPLCGRW